MRKDLPAAILLVSSLLLNCGVEPPPSESRQVGTYDEWYMWTDDGVRHYVLELGEGPTVVVLHGGWGAEHSYLLDLLEPLADRFRFVLYDQRGSLRSPAPDETISLGNLVADLERLRRQVGEDRMTLLTHSMGSQLAYAYLARHMQRVGALVMLGPVIPTGAELDDDGAAWAQPQFVEFAQGNEARQVAAEGLDGKDWQEMTDREKSARNQISLASGNIFHIERWRQVRGGQVFYNGRVYPLLQENTPSEEWNGQYETLQRATIPVQVIIGDHDLVDFGLQAWPDLVDTLSDATLTVIENAGHNAWIDDPDGVEAALTRSLAIALRGAVRRAVDQRRARLRK